MPKGAKKRKSAKKKKEIQSNDPSSASTLSHDDVKHQEDKDSDVSEVSSPASQDHHSQQNISTEGDEEETKNEESAVQIEREFKVEGESYEKDGKIEHDEARKSYYGGSSRSSSSSSSSSSDYDDESQSMKSNPAVVDNSPVVESVKATDLLSETAAEPISTAVIEEANISVVETPVVDEITSLVEKAEVDSASKGSFEKIENSFESKVGISAEFVDAVTETEEEEGSVIQSVENIAAVTDPKECVIQENDDRLTPSYGAEHVTANNGRESEKDTVTQPLLEQQPVERSSWKSCCGLCELFGK